MERVMEKKTSISRREFLKLALAGIGVGFVGKYLTDIGKLYLSEGAPPEGVDQNFNVQEIKNIEATPTSTHEPTNTPQKPQTPEPTRTLEPTQTPTATPEVKSPVDQYIIKEKIDLASTEPMKWLFVLPENKAILTPIAKPYSYSPENNDAGIFDWRNHTTYTYLEKNNTPILWGHEGVDELFFNTLAEYLRKPEGSLLTRAEAEKSMYENFLGSKVILMQAADETLLPKDVASVNLRDKNIRSVEMTVTAGLLVPRWQEVDKVDPTGKFPASDAKVAFEGGYKVDWIAGWYEKHTMDIYDSIRQVYPDSPADPAHTNSQFKGLPGKDTLGVKFCMRKLAGDGACSTDANGNEVIAASYGRVFLTLKATS
jgi:hypothetical protein